MAYALSKNALDELGSAADEKAWSRQLQRLARSVMTAPESVGELASVAGGPDDDRRVRNACALLSSALDEARMARENGRSEGETFLDAMNDFLATQERSNQLTPELRMRFAQLYARAQLEVPETCLLDNASSDDQVDALDASTSLPDVSALLQDVLRDVGGDPLQVHSAVNEFSAAAPLPVRAQLVRALASRGGGLEGRLACYWLLDRSSAIRLAAAQALADQARRGSLDPGLAIPLSTLRKWLPDEPSREALDEAIKVNLRAGVANAPSARWRVERVMASLPDGAGAQSIAAVVQRDKTRAVLMLLLKQGHGVKDAFLVNVGTAGRQKKMLEEIAKEVGGFEVSPDYAIEALARALGDGISNGAVNAPGVVDAADVFGWDRLDPAPSDTAAVLASIDASSHTAKMSAAAKADLVRQSAQWSGAFRQAESWFEDNGDVQSICASARSERALKSALRKYLETRREWWALLFARSAATLRARSSGDDEVWLSFAMTAQALLEGQSLARIPIMSEILETTIEAALVEAQGGLASPDPAQNQPSSSRTPQGEDPEELRWLFQKAPFSQAWLEGYLVALNVSPRPPTSTQWIGPLLGGVELEGMNSVQRALDVIVARANRISSEAADETNVARWLAAYDAADFSAFVQGFLALHAAARSAWPAKALTADDKKMLAAIASAAKGRDEHWLRAVLPAWVSRRHALRG